MEQHDRDALVRTLTDSLGPFKPLPGEDAEEAARLSPRLLSRLRGPRLTDPYGAISWPPPAADDGHRPVLREIVQLGPALASDAHLAATQAVLAACRRPGHALVLAVHGLGGRHRLAVGLRRCLGAGGDSTADLLDVQERALTTSFPGLRLAPEQSTDWANVETFLRRAPLLEALTGVPGSPATDKVLCGLDLLLQMRVGDRFMLLFVAEPLPEAAVEAAHRSCCDCLVQIQARPRRSREDGRRVERTLPGSISVRAPTGGLFGSPLASMAFMAGPIYSVILSTLGQVSQGKTTSVEQSVKEDGQQFSAEQVRRAWDIAEGDTCERLLEHYRQRLEQGLTAGWWRTAVYLAAEDEASLRATGGALSALYTNETPGSEPARLHAPPTPAHAYALRLAMVQARTLDLPADPDGAHPLGEVFNFLGTCLTAGELARLLQPPRRELLGLPQRPLLRFGLNPRHAGGAVLGTVCDETGRPAGPLALPAEALNHHVFVTGTTGYGKTNTCMQLLLQAYETHRVPFLVIEPAKTEWRWLASLFGPHARLREQLRVYSVGATGLPFRLNPFQWVRGTSLTRHIDLLKAVFGASLHDLDGGMMYTLEEAILDVYSHKGWDLADGTHPELERQKRNRQLGALDLETARACLLPTLDDLHDHVWNVVLRKGFTGQALYLATALRTRLGSLLRGNKGRILNTRRSAPLDPELADMESLFTRPTVIELEDLGDDDDKAFVMALLFVLLNEWARVRSQGIRSDWDQLKHVTLIEEAHRLLRSPESLGGDANNPQAKAVDLFTNMLAEMRALGEGFIIADQIPTRLAPETLKNTNLKIIHRLAHADDRSVVGRCVSLTEEQTEQLNTLAPGYAVVHDQRIAEAVLVRVHPFELKGPGHLRPSEEQLTRSLAGLSDTAFLRRNAACSCCKSPCTYLPQLQKYESAAGPSQAVAGLQGFARSLLEEDGVEMAWEGWQSWRQEWTRDNPALEELSQEAQVGATSCVATQALYEWLGQRFADRFRRGGLETPAPPPSGNTPPTSPGPAEAPTPLASSSRLSPRELLAREKSAAALARLVTDWLGKSSLDALGRLIFAQTRELLRSNLPAGPPEGRENPASSH